MSNRVCVACIFASGQLTEPQNKFTSFAQLGAGPDLAFVSLDNLINDGQSEPSAAFKFGLERLEDLFYELRPHARTCVGEIDLPVTVLRLYRNPQSSPIFHGADCVFAEIPENLFELVAVGQSPCLRNFEV